MKYIVRITSGLRYNILLMNVQTNDKKKLIIIFLILATIKMKFSKRNYINQIIVE